MCVCACVRGSVRILQRDLLTPDNSNQQEEWEEGAVSPLLTNG